MKHTHTHTDTLYYTKLNKVSSFRIKIVYNVIP